MEILVVILDLAVVFFAKVLDNLLSTSKTILIQKNKGLLAGICVFLSEFIFYKLVKAVSGSGDAMIIVISIASGVGTFLAIFLSNKFSKEKTFINVLLCDDKKVMMQLRDFLKEHKITNLATDGYTKGWKKSIAITAYAETKNQSKLIDDYLKNLDVKVKRIISVN